ncbi:glycosyl transferase [Synechococcales cyanobacterium C]|uniref:Glycosyl transferase n=1 Tax=Petrachloros mirabilis ULC683 TaxID=2781853 RepID=A0A8K2A939_9CYAN|nr:glycosyltransferase [Petrachloros mirabilis]NCJ07580.1 glycosyl transferase [Petrachloros mirabilis ULC683]
MKKPKILFYCQHILGIGHLIRSMEIVRGLLADFEVCFVNGGRVIEAFPTPAGVRVVNLPAIATDPAFQSLEVIDANQSLADVFAARTAQLLTLLDEVQPDILVVELFPFGRRRFSAELIPCLEAAKARGCKVVCSLRDIVVTKQDQTRHEAKICRLMNQYFDLLLIHGDPTFQPLELSFSRVQDLHCPVHYTGYVVQQPAELDAGLDADLAQINPDRPLIVTSVGGGRFGHELLFCVAAAAPFLAHLPHQLLIFAGPFVPLAVFTQLQAQAAQCPNVVLQRYTPNLLSYLTQADLSISMAGYNTTMNVLTCGVRAMMLPFTGNDDQEQSLRAERLEALGIIRVIRPEDLQPERFAERVLECLRQQPTPRSFDFQGVEKTATYLKDLAGCKVAVSGSAC